MDLEHETRQFKWMLAALLIFACSAFFSWREVKYAVLGKEVDARLVRIREWTERSGRTTKQVWLIDYSFTDPPGTERRESDTLPITADTPMEKTLKVQYLPGSPGLSRLPQNSRQFWILIFLGSLAFVAFKFFQLVRESKT